ncbi:unnamed protein product [Porites lobata]|uniref:Uncharacterized protein n=1 Tax=Porites lobata TaxID=104759 RepID=A0ABN8PVG4_9CNID|nr:unnamed protein product [Porites lobata]
MAQTQYAINGHTTKPTRRSAIAIDTMMRLEGEDLSFFKGSFQTDKTTNKFPKTIIADMTIAGMEKAIDMTFIDNVKGRRYLKRPQRYQKQRRPLRHLEEAFDHIAHYLYASPPSMIEDCHA